MSQNIKLIGQMKATLYKENGDVEVTEKNNLITEVGFDFLMDCLGKSSGRPDPVSYIAVGTGTTAANTADTELETELSRQALSYSHTAGDDFFEVEATFAAGTATGAITEAGVINAASSGTLFNHVVFSAINKGAGDVLVQTFKFTFA